VRVKAVLVMLAGAFFPVHFLQAQEIPVTWRATLDWDVGDWDGPLSLTYITDLTVGPDGRLFVTQPQDNAVWVFNSDGTRSAVIGRRGQGPGEFDYPRSLFWLADSLAVWDTRLARISVFSERDVFTRSFPAIVASMQLGLLEDRSLVSVQGGVLDRDLASGRITQLPLMRWDPRSNRSDTLAILPADHLMLGVDTGNGHLYTRQPFSDSPIWRVTPGGRRLVLVEREVAEAREAQTFSISVFESTGQVIFRRDIPFDPVPLRRSTIIDTARRQSDRIKADRESIGLSSPPGTYTPDDFREAYFLPEFQPPVEDVALGADGSIWLRRESEEGRPDVSWLILNGAAEPIATINLPRDLEIVCPAGDWIYAARRDEMDVLHLLRFSLHRPVSRS
jgi:hypothetical protein